MSILHIYILLLLAGSSRSRLPQSDSTPRYIFFISPGSAAQNRLENMPLRCSVMYLSSSYIDSDALFPSLERKLGVRRCLSPPSRGNTYILALLPLRRIRCYWKLMLCPIHLMPDPTTNDVRRTLAIRSSQEQVFRKNVRCCDVPLYRNPQTTA